MSTMPPNTALGSSIVGNDDIFVRGQPGLCWIRRFFRALHDPLPASHGCWSSHSTRWVSWMLWCHQREYLSSRDGEFMAALVF